MRLAKRIALLLAIVTLMVPTARADLIGHWTFNGGSGTDLSGNHHDGTIVDGTYTAGPVAGSSALLFNGTSSSVTVPYSAQLSLGGSPFTIAFWVDYLGQTTQVNQMVVNCDNLAEWNGGYDVALPTNVTAHPGSIQTSVNGGSGTGDNEYQYSTSPFPVGVWKHVAVVDNGADRYLYVNGVLDTAATRSSTEPIDRKVANPLYSGDPLVFGAWGAGSSYYFNGALADMQIYNQALTEAQVGTVMGGGVVPEPSTLVLLGMGLLSLLAYAWKKRR